MKRIILGIFALAILVSFVACDFFTTSWGSGLQRDLDAMLKNESPDDLAKLASDQNYKGDSKAAAALLNALGTKSKDEINKLSPEAKSDILDLALTATLPIDAIAGIVDDLDTMDPSDILDLLSENIIEFDTKVVQAILNDPEGVDSESLVSASVAVVAQVFKREEGLGIGDIETLFENKGEGNKLDFTDLDDIDQQSKDDLEAVFKVFNLLKDENPTFLDFSLEDLFGGNE